MRKHHFTGGCTVNFCRLRDLSRQKNDEHDDRLLEDEEPHSLSSTPVSIASIQIASYRQSASKYIIHPQLTTLVQLFLSRLWRQLDVVTQQQKEASQGSGFIYIQKRSEVYGLALSHDGEEGNNYEDRYGESNTDDPSAWPDRSVIVLMSVHVWGRRTASAPRDWSNASHAS